MTRRAFVLISGVLLCRAGAAQIPGLEEILKGVENLPKPATGRSGMGNADVTTAAAGIREALAIGTERAVKSLSQVNGYFANAAVKILLPPSIQKIAEFARVAGYQKQVDGFILSMNRAAEAAAPLAVRYFGDAIRAMSLDDVRGILTGGGTSATDFFRRKTSKELYDAFKPIVSQKVDDVGATRAYKNLVGPYESLAMLGGQSLDLDDYVTNKSLDGLFYMVGQEEKKIRTNPAARTTELLKTVFGR